MAHSSRKKDKIVIISDPIPQENQDDDKEILRYHNNHVLVSPLLEVFSVSIIDSKKLPSSSKPFEVYGVISPLYEKKMEFPDIVTAGGHLPLLKGPFSASDVMHGQVSLRDKVRNLKLAEESFTLDYKTQDCYEKINCLEFQAPYSIRSKNKKKGPYSIVKMSYSVFPRAVTALLEVKLIKEDDFSDCGHIDLCGSLVACLRTAQLDYPSILLLKNREHEYTRVRFDSPIQLLRSDVAVPVHGLLQIEGVLESSDLRYKVSCEGLEFKLEKYGPYGSVVGKSVAGKHCRLEIHVTWMYYDLYFSKQKRTKTSESSIDRIPLVKTPKFGFQGCRLPLVEVFSLVLGSDTTADLRICGTVTISDQLGTLTRFSREGDNPMFVYPGSRILHLSDMDRVNVGSFVCVEISLKDLNGSLDVKGSIWWNLHSLKSGMSWYDRQLCSVIPGKVGNACMHYSVFSSGGLVAELSAVLQGCGTSDTNLSTCHVSGSVVARYGRWQYSTYYEKEYYQCVIFERSRKGSQELDMSANFCALPLVRKLVPTPSASSLIIEAELNCGSGGGASMSTIPIGGIIEFEHGKDDMKAIRSCEGLKFRHRKDDSEDVQRREDVQIRDFYLEVSVTWRLEI